ncbi:hypothetical protein WUBG_03931, partial [Wuchereria bancrofti]
SSSPSQSSLLSLPSLSLSLLLSLSLSKYTPGRISLFLVSCIYYGALYFAI